MSRGLGEFFLLTLSRGVENWLGRECSRKRDVEGILTRANRANDKTLYSVTNEKCVFPFFVYSPRSCNDIFRFESESMYFFSRFELLARASRIERGKRNGWFERNILLLSFLLSLSRWRASEKQGGIQGPGG